MRQERRQDPRLELLLAAAFRVAESGKWHEATIQNLSAGGAGVITPFEVPAGDRIDSLRFRLPAHGSQPEGWIETRAHVVRSGPCHAKNGVPQCKLGMRFVTMDEISARRVRRFVFDQIMESPERWRKLRSANQRLALTDAGAIKLRFDRLKEFETQFTGNISLGGMFLRSEDLHPPGTVFDFTLELGDNFTLVAGRGEVLWIREPIEGSRLAAGMGIRFLEMDEESLAVVRRMVERQKAKALSGEARRHRSIAAKKLVAARNSTTLAWVPLRAAPVVQSAQAALQHYPEPETLANQEMAARLSDSQALANSLHARIARDKSTLDDLTLELADLAGGHENLNLRLSQELVTRARLEERHAWLALQNQHLAKSETSSRSILLELSARGTHERTESEKQLEWTRKEAHTLEFALKQANVTLTVLSHQQLCDEETLHQVSKLLETSRDENLELQQGWSSAREEADELRGSAERMSSENTSIEKQLAESRKQYESLRAELDEAQTVIKALFRKGKTLEQSIASRDLAVRDAQKKTEELEKTLLLSNQELESTRKAGKEQLADSQQQSLELKSALVAADLADSKQTKLGARLVRARRSLSRRRWRDSSRVALGALGCLVLVALGYGLLRDSPGEEAPRSVVESAVATPLPAPESTQTVATETPVSVSSSPPAPAFDSNEVQAAVESWARAWAEQRVNDYLGAYADSFTPPHGATRAQWKQERQRRISTPGYIEVDLANLHITSTDENRATARFEQTYRSPGYTDHTLKTLELERGDSGWRIVSELGEPIPGTP